MLSRTLRASIALLAATLVAATMTAPASASYHRGNSINLNVFNRSSVDVTAAYCPNGHVSIHYQFGTTHDPCNVTPFVHHMAARTGGWLDYTANPMGVIVRAPHHHTFYFYLFNPSVGLPYVIVNGNKLTMVEGQETHMAVSNGLVAFHRRGDSNGHKQFIIEILRMGR